MTFQHQNTQQIYHMSGYLLSIPTFHFPWLVQDIA